MKIVTVESLGFGQGVKGEGLQEHLFKNSLHCQEVDCIPIMDNTEINLDKPVLVLFRNRTFRTLRMEKKGRTLTLSDSIDAVKDYHLLPSDRVLIKS